MPAYQAYGLSIASDIELPELIPLSSDDGLGDPAVSVMVRVGKVDLSPSTGAHEILRWARPGDACVRYDGVAAFHVTGGRSILVEPAPDADERAVRLFLLGPAFSLLLDQRGLLVLHASGVAIEGQVVAFLGEKGEGKSTLAAAMLERGHAMVGDDLLPVDLAAPNAALVVPAYPQLKLMPDAIEHLGTSSENRMKLHPDSEKRAHAPSRFIQTPLPLARIFVLESGEADGIETLVAQQRVIELVRHSYLARLLETTGESAAHFRQVVELARRVPVCKLTRRRELARLDQVAEMVEAEVCSASMSS